VERRDAERQPARESPRRRERRSVRGSPRIEPPRGIAGPSSHAVPPGGDLALTIDLQKWRVVDGWRAGDYRVALELRNVGVGDGRVRLAVASEALAFTMAP
jgi:hypothetical protein